MGGYGSGRMGGRVTVEGTESIVLSVHWLRRRGVVRPNAKTQAKIASDSLDLAITSYASDDSGELRMQGAVETFAHGRFALDQFITLETTPGTFGGRRWWFRCPISGRRIAKIYLPNGATRFAGRKAYRLAYQSQRETALDRAARRVRKLNRAIGGDGGDECPIKPKGMRWATYNRKFQEWEDADIAADTLFACRLSRYLKVPLV